jgi:surface antigen
MNIHSPKTTFPREQSHPALRCLPLGASLVVVAMLSGCTPGAMNHWADAASRIVAYKTGIPTSFTAPILRDMGQFLIQGPLAQMLQPEDRQRASQATTQVLNQGTPGSTAVWQNPQDRSIKGKAQATNVYAKAGGGECMTVDEVGTMHGKEIRQTSTYCKKPGENGWTVVS